MATSNAILPGWQAECYQATAGPVMLAGVPANFFVVLVLASIFCGMVMPKILIVSALAYLVAWIGTGWEPYWYSMLSEYREYRSYYDA